MAMGENSANDSADFYKKFSGAQYIGQFANKYLLFENNKTLLLVDQHAAQERITYEALIRQMQSGKLEVQHLLSPILIKLTHQELLSWEESQEKLQSIGFENNQWDEETIAIHSHPLLIKNIEMSVRELLDGASIAKCDHDDIARRACRSSVMSGDRMSKEQAEYQRTALLKCLDPFTCPHGRPTVIEMPLGFLDKQFLRT
jgi:DNA mismatch repair protein MutL